MKRSKPAFFIAYRTQVLRDTPGVWKSTTMAYYTEAEAAASVARCDPKNARTWSVYASAYGVMHNGQVSHIVTK